MARPVKNRRVFEMPVNRLFKPAGIEMNQLSENVLKLEELEALRLKDLEGFDQEACAVQMDVSRPTFQRILMSAREKVADSLLHGKAIRIDGGDYIHSEDDHFCKRCGHGWEGRGMRKGNRRNHGLDD